MLKEDEFMTLNDLRDEIAALGFEDSVEINKSLTTAANRALITLFTERPVARTVRITKVCEAPLFHVPKINHSGAHDVTVGLLGRAFSFRVSGKGHFTVSDGIVTSTKEFDAPDARFCGKIRNAGASITFSGDYLYTVFDFACYSELTGEREKDIPEYSPYTEYDINFMFGDFLSFLEPPRENGTVINDAVMQNGIIRLPTGKYSEISLTYARMPRRVSEDNPGDEIDVSGECSPLLSLLCASYMWLDDDADKAQYYMSLYRNGMSFIRRYNTSISECGYNDVLGWA